VIKGMRMKWVRHASHVRDKRNAYKILMESLRGINYLGDVDISGRIILSCVSG
jgi:hypothetical protein